MSWRESRRYPGVLIRDLPEDYFCHLEIHPSWVGWPGRYLLYWVSVDGPRWYRFKGIYETMAQAQAAGDLL